jgi:hypothetical protein
MLALARTKRKVSLSPSPAMNALPPSRYVILATALCSSVLADPYTSYVGKSPPVPRNSSRDVDRVSLLLRPSSSRPAGSPIRINSEMLKRFVQENEPLKKIQADLGVAQKRLRELQQAGEYTGDIEAEIARLEAARRALRRSP